MGPSSLEAPSPSAEENNDLKSSVAAVPPPQAIYDSTPPEETNASTSTTTGTTTTTSKPLTDLVSNPLPPVERDITNKLVTSPPLDSSKKASSTPKNQQNNSGGKRTFTATVTDYDPQICDGFLVEAAVACFVLKGEDRYTFVTNSSEPLLDKVQSMSTTAAPTPSSVSFSSGAGSRSPRFRRKQASSGSSSEQQQQQPPQSVVSGGGVGGDVDHGGGARLVAFAGVFDGHDGPKASQYCSRGMLHHILAETNRVSQKVQKEYNKSSGGGSSSTRSFFGGGGGSVSGGGGGGGGDSISSRGGGSSSSAHTSSTSFKSKSRTTFFGPKSTNNDDNQQQSNTNKSSTNKDINIQVLKQGHVNGFTWAQTRFGTGADPPTWDELLEQNSDIQQIRTGTKSAASNFFHRLFFGSTSIRSIRGGTTATTIALYSKSDDGTSSSSNHNNKNTIKPIKEGEISSTNDTTPSTTSRIRRRPVLCALVACTGDSRCITDDGGTKNAYGSNLTEYRAVTKDHRPGEPEESRRIQKLVKKGVCLLQKDDNPFGTLRLYPGGLAVSRTVGDVQLTEAAIPTPEVFTVALNFDPSNEKHVTYRFVIASDGLWDVFDTDDVGRIVSQDIFDDDSDEIDQTKNDQEQAAVDGTTTTTNKGDDNGNGNNNNNDKTDKDSSSSRPQQRRRRRRTPKQAAKELLDSCIKQGGYEDDVTILVLDVSLAPTDKDTNQSATTSTTGDQ